MCGCSVPCGGTAWIAISDGRWRSFTRALLSVAEVPADPLWRPHAHLYPASELACGKEGTYEPDPRGGEGSAGAGPSLKRCIKGGR